MILHEEEEAVGRHMSIDFNGTDADRSLARDGLQFMKPLMFSLALRRRLNLCSCL